MALHAYLSSGEESQQQQAVEHLRNAPAYWDEVVAITRPLYRDMKLTHYNHNFYVPNDDNLFHWALIRDEVARDVEIAAGSKAKEAH
ncbi:hypothetical protein [Peristeroidobacter agariperforans]|uniref:hypothetical protein n=1 Tax=Peristeroidobacter agariperforans TaxID=268404 RepID=UPI00101D349D|nr:hypothetical protein [Peristeroidobacter agariperforans]